MNSLKQFAQSEDGIVTVEYVMLTAGMVSLGLAAAAIISTGMEDLSSETAQAMGAGDITQLSRFDLNTTPARTPD